MTRGRDGYSPGVLPNLTMSRAAPQRGNFLQLLENSRKSTGQRMDLMKRGLQFRNPGSERASGNVNWGSRIDFCQFWVIGKMKNKS